MPEIHIIGGGTLSHVRCGLSLAVPDFGEIANLVQWGFWKLREDDPEQYCKFKYFQHLTAMAEGGSSLITADDVSSLVERLISNENTAIIFLVGGLLDFDGCVGRPDWDHYEPTPKGKEQPRLQPNVGSGEEHLILTSRESICGKIRRERKDIFLVASYQTAGLDQQAQYFEALRFLKTNSCNLVITQDSSTGCSMVVAPEEARYGVRDSNLLGTTNTLVDMSMKRYGLTYSRTELLPGEPVAWSSPRIPSTLKRVVEYCISEGAYKPLFGKTVGHFSFRESESSFLVSRRGVDYNRLDEFGMVEVSIEHLEDDGYQVRAVGAKPSAGAQTQRLIFQDHPQYDCIIHFHCPIKEGSDIPLRPQYAFECGSIECGKNTSKGLKSYGNLAAVMLDQHGPNIVFNHKTDPQEVIAFIAKHCDLAQKTGGYNPELVC